MGGRGRASAEGGGGVFRLWDEGESFGCGGIGRASVVGGSASVVRW